MWNWSRQQKRRKKMCKSSLLNQNEVITHWFLESEQKNMFRMTHNTILERIANEERTRQDTIMQTDVMLSLYSNVTSDLTCLQTEFHHNLLLKTFRKQKYRENNKMFTFFTGLKTAKVFHGPKRLLRWFFIPELRINQFTQYISLIPMPVDTRALSRTIRTPLKIAFNLMWWVSFVYF